jgi:hypothetical protein
MVVREVSHEELEQLIEKYYFIDVAHFIAGATGIGKSFTVKKKARDIAGKLNREFVEWNKLTKEEKHNVAQHPEKYFFLMDIRLSQLDPSDLRGLPGLNGKDTVEWKIPFWHYVASLKGSKGIIFFDELNLAPPSIQASAYQIIYDRELGEVPLQKGVLPIAAGNRLEDKANVYDLPRPLQNRFTHSTLKLPTISQDCKSSDGTTNWGEWALNNGIDMRIVTFLMQHPNLLNPAINEHSNDRAFPTPRTWEVCSRLIQGESDLEWMRTLATTAVGAGTANELIADIKFSRKIDLKDILAHPEKAADIKEMDLKYSLLALVSEWYSVNFKNSDLEKVLQISNVIQAEFAILLLRFCKNKHKQSFISNVTKLKSWEPISKKYQKYLIG